ncbi:MAG: sensor histidine kinase [Bacteroidota bacterium]
METEVILVITITLVILVSIIVALLAIFQTRKNKYLLAEKKFEDEISRSQMEITEQALKNISWELHDNVGQLLSIVKMQLNILKNELPKSEDQLDEVSELVGKSLNEIRLLSKTLNPESILKMGLIKALRIELDRFDRLKFVKTSIDVEGSIQEISERDEIIIFRILQEFFTNVIKHSKADSLNVKLAYLSGKVIITAEDDGVGFNANEVVEGSGLMNMKSRAKLVGGTLKIDAGLNQGVKLYLEYPYKNDIK